MGNVQTMYRDTMYPDEQPNWRDLNPTFDPNYGFPEGRKERVMIATQDEMESALLPLEERDYCAHLRIKYRACYADMFPWVSRCASVRHEVEQCSVEDCTLRMKEYERERRLLQRAKRKALKAEREQHEVMN